MPSIRTISVSGSIPSITQLALGDLAVNTYDGKAYLKKQQGNTQTVVEIGGGGAAAGVTQIIAGTNITISPVGGTGAVTINAGTPVSASYALSASYATTSSYATNFKVSGSITGVDYIDFDTAASVTQPSIGRLSWNQTDKTLDLGTGDGNTTLQIGQETVYPPIVNKDSIDLGEGTLVMVDPTQIAQGNRIRVVRAISNGTYPSQYLVGILTEDIAINQEGYATWFGYVRNLNIPTLESNGVKPIAEAWAEGNVLYPNPAVSGGLTYTQPTGPAIKSTIAVITAINGNNLTLLVRPTFTLNVGELNNVNDSTSTTSYGELFVKSGSVWTTGRSLTGSYSITGSLTISGSSTFTNIGPAIFSGSVTGIAGFTGSLSGSALTAVSASFASTASYVNPLVQNVIITGSATNSLLVKGSGATSATNALLIQNSSNNSSLIVQDDGRVGINKAPTTASLHILTPGTSTDPKIVAVFEGYVSPAQPEVKILIGGDTATATANGYGSWFGHNVKPSSEGNFGFVQTGKGPRTLTWNNAGHVAIGTVTGAFSKNIFRIEPKAFDSNTNWDTSGIMFCVQSGSVQVVSPDSASHVAMSGFGINTLNSVVYTRTLANASTVYIDGAPRAGSSLSITSSWALYVNSGSSYFKDNVLVGTTSSLGYKVNISGSGNIINNLTVTGSITSLGGITGSLLGTAATASYVNPLTQSVSIKGTGTTSATTALSVENSSAATSMVVLDNGNIGFGITTPSQKIHSVATGDIYSLIQSTGTGGAGNIYKNTYREYFTGTNYATANSWEVYDLTAGAPVIHVSGVSRAVGINKINASYQLDVAGDIRTTLGAFLATTSGFVGIGTTSPATLLDVNGSGRFSSGVVITGSLNVTNNITASIISATNNGIGTNFKVGDDTWIGDINVANTMQVMGQQNADRGYIRFGSGSSNPVLGANNSNTLDLTGNLTTTGTINSVTLDNNSWASYGVMWSSDAVPPSLGNGTLEGYYKQIGKTVFIRVKLVFGTTTNGGSGNWYFSLPTNAAAAYGVQFPCSILNDGLAWYQGTVNGQYGGFIDKTAVIVQSAGGANSSQGLTATHPFTFGNLDSVQFNGSYEAL